METSGNHLQKFIESTQTLILYPFDDNGLSWDLTLFSMGSALKALSRNHIMDLVNGHKSPFSITNIIIFE